MPVQLRLPTMLGALVDGRCVIAVEGATLHEVLTATATEHPVLGSRLLAADGRAHPFIAYYVNGRDSRPLGGLSAPVRDGDEVTVVAAVAGG